MLTKWIVALRDCAGQFSADGGGVVLMWSGHGIPSAGSASVRLLARDSLNDSSGGIDAVEVATKVAATGANQILFIVDTCHAGNAVDSVVGLYNHFRVNPPAGEWCWFGLLAACGPEKVRQHVLGPALERLLRDGPRPDGPHADDIRRRWSTPPDSKAHNGGGCSLRTLRQRSPCSEGAPTTRPDSRRWRGLVMGLAQAGR